jgi:hypothetical protein
MEAETFRKGIKNIEVYGSHMGMGANASILLMTANALSANIHGEGIQDVTSNIERFLYPNFWNKARKAFKINKSIVQVIKS